MRFSPVIFALLAICVLNFIGCRSTSYKSLRFKHQQEYHLPMASNPTYFTVNYEAESKQLFFYSFPNQYGYFYDWNTKKLIDSIHFKQYTQKYNINKVQFLNPNELLLFFNVNWYPNDNYDSSFCTYNIQNRTFKRLDTRDWPFYGQEGQQLPNISQRYLWYHAELPYQNGRMAAVLASSKYNMGDTGYQQLKQSLGGYFQIVNDTQVKFHEFPLYFPKWAYAQRYISDFRYIRSVMNNKGNPVFAFGMSPNYVEYDVASQQKKYYRVPSVLLDTVRPFPVDAKGRPIDSKGNRLIDPVEDPHEGEFYDFRYDPFRNQYWRFLELRPEANASIVERNRRIYALQIFNDQFQLLGEGLLPDELQPMRDGEKWIRMFFTPEGPVIHNPRRSEAFDGISMVFTRYEPQFGRQNPLKQQAKHKRIKGRQTEDWKGYLAQVHQQNADSAAYIVIDPRNCCPACKYYMLEYFENHLQEHPDRPLKLVLTGTSKQPIQEALDYLKTQKHDNRRVFIDDKGDYKRYVLNFLNPKLVLLRKGELVFNRQLNPADLKDVEQYLDRFYKGEAIRAANGAE
jgi:hypothetical protein